MRGGIATSHLDSAHSKQRPNRAGGLGAFLVEGALDGIGQHAGDVTHGLEDFAVVVVDLDHAMLLYEQ
jgi:hypothetical protein